MTKKELRTQYFVILYIRCYNSQWNIGAMQMSCHLQNVLFGKGAFGALEWLTSVRDFWADFERSQRDYKKRLKTIFFHLKRT
jgi:hypothetical protein